MFAGRQARKQLARAKDLYVAGSLDGSMEALTAITDRLVGSDRPGDRHAVAEAWEVRARIEIDRGRTEAAIDAFFSAIEALDADDHSHHELLGRVEYQLASTAFDLRNLEGQWVTYFERARDHLAPFPEYRELVLNAEEAIGLLEARDWRDRRRELSERLEQLDGQLEALAPGSGNEDELEQVMWSYLGTMQRLGALLIEHGDDAECSEGLALLCQRAEINGPSDLSDFLDGLFPLAVTLDRPGVTMPEPFAELVEVAERAAADSGEASHRSMASFLAGVLHINEGRTEAALASALGALADAEGVFAHTRLAPMRAMQLPFLAQYRHMALTAAVALGRGAVCAELIETTRPQVLPIAPVAGVDDRHGSLAEALADGVAPFGSSTRVSVDGTSAVATAAAEVGGEAMRTISLESAIDGAGGSHAWWWGGWLGLGDYCWSVRDPSGAWHCGRIRLDDDLRSELAEFGAIYHREGEDLPPDLGEDYAIEHERSVTLGEAFVPPPLAEALRELELGSLSVVVSGNVAGLLPLATLVVPGTADVRLVERAVVRVQPPTHLVERVMARVSDPAGPWPLAVACLDPRGDLRNARHLDLEAERVLTAGVLVAERESPGVPATRANLRAALAAVGAGANALFFFSGHVSPGNQGGDLLTHLVLDGDRATAADFFGCGLDEPLVAPSRVLLSACDSGGSAGSGSGEWFGLGAALLAAGARQLVATAWPILDCSFGGAFERALALRLQDAIDPAQALREEQLEALAAWREHRGADPDLDGAPLPAVWASFQAIGVLL